MSKQRSKVKTEKNFLSSKAQKDAIYKIYRSCRLCGATTGYRMPIVQNIIPIEDTEVELKTKIQECLQIEVHEADKMPPLICELCADKINDFYDFLMMCKQTNKHTRMRLGLGPIPEIRKNIDTSDSELGTTELVFKTDKKETGNGRANEKDSIKNKISIKKAKEVKEVKKEIKKEIDKIKKETRAERELRDLIASNPVLYSSQRSRYSRTREDRQSPKRQPSPPPKKLRSENRSEKIETKNELPIRPGPASAKLKRLRDIISSDVESKKIKIDEPRSKRLSTIKVTDNSKTSGMQTCDICKVQFQKGTSFNNHYRIHKKVETSATKPEVETHQSKVEESKIVGKCRKCGKPFEVYRTFIKHQAACRGGKVKLLPSLPRSMKPVQVRMIRCDSLLINDENGHYDVSNVRCPYGLDRSCLYPYNRHNSLLHSNRMVDIKLPEIPDEFDIDDDTEEFVDSDNESHEDRPLNVESLSTLSLKIIFSDKFLGKVPKRRKKIKSFYNDFGIKIDKIISNFDIDEMKNSKSIFDNIKDNWSDNVSDSILRNDNDSDTFSFIGELNDDSCSYTNKCDDEINNKSKSNQSVEANRLEDERSSPIGDVPMLEVSNSKHNLDTETSTNDSTDNQMNDRSLTHTQESSGVSGNLSESIQDIPWNDKNNISCQLENLNTVKSGIELLEIQILNDNDEEAYSDKQANAENKENEPNGDYNKRDAISSEMESNSVAEITKTCESFAESNSNETVPRCQDLPACEIAVENNLIENLTQTEKTDEINENSVNERVNNENKHVNTDTNDNEKEILDSDTYNTKNLDYSFQATEDISMRNDLTPDINITNDFNKECFHEVNTQPEIIIQNCFSLSNHFNNIGEKGSVQNNEIQNTMDITKIEDTTKTVNLPENTIDGDDDLIESNILNDEKIDTVHREDKTNEIINGDDIGINSNNLEDISDDEMDNDIYEKSNITLDDLTPDKSMDLDNISDGEFTLDD